EIPGSVTRTSWALNVKSRTLRAEIDLPNPNAKLLPGMYAYARVHIHRDGVMALPNAAIFNSGNQNYCYLLVAGKAMQTPIQTGISDGHFTEVPKKQIHDQWIDWAGDEQVILGNLSEISGGQAVEVASSDTSSGGQPKH
ncbi:MAG TPA: hypothetical protein VMF30_09720, partial [Pirellulales bacterium]|nr:hypothetical protein [Pirellulales bacterium]